MTPPAAPADPLRELARDWARRHEIARALARAEEDGDTFAIFFAGFTAGREAEREAWLAGLVRATGRTERTDRFAVPSPDGNAPETWPTLELAAEHAERLYRKESTP